MEKGGMPTGHTFSSSWAYVRYKYSDPQKSAARSNCRCGELNRSDQLGSTRKSYSGPRDVQFGILWKGKHFESIILDDQLGDTSSTGSLIFFFHSPRVYLNSISST